MNRVGWTVTAICTALAALALAPAARADGIPPQVWIDGYHSPTEDIFAFTVHGRAITEGATVATATVTLNGTTVASGDLTCATPPCGEGSVPLSFDTRDFADAVYDLKITVADSAGGVASDDHPAFEVWNNRPTGSSSATLNIGSGVPAPPPQAGPGGSVRGASAGSCVKPKLSMQLSQKPLRMRRGVPVLVKGKRYRFSGRLTCLVNGRRVSAPKRTRIELRVILRGKSYAKGRAAVGSRGRIAVRIAAASSRTLEFRFRTADGNVTRVRIKVQAVKVAKHRHKKG